jgi:hypothetical protein
MVRRPKVGARCGKSARRVLSGGRPERAVPTGTGGPGRQLPGLPDKDTLRSWTPMEGLVGIFGLIFTLILSRFVGA